MTTVHFHSALDTVLGDTAPLPMETVPLVDAVRRRLFDTLVATRDAPEFDHSAMDGYALIAAETNGANAGTTIHFDVTDALYAGDGNRHVVKPGQCVFIATGAEIPKNATAVVRLEDVAEDAGRIAVAAPVNPRRNIRRRGEFYKTGELLIRPGTALTPFMISLAASCGLPTLTVYRRPKIFILTTGDELIQPGCPLSPGMIYNSNQYLLRSLSVPLECAVIGCAHLTDHQEKTADAIRDGIERADVLLMTGGVSVGRKDFVKEALRSVGVRLKFDRIFAKPGKPTVFGTYRKKSGGNTLVFGLPGSPLSASLMYVSLVAPCIKKLNGARPETDGIEYGRLTKRIEVASHISTLLPVKVCVERECVQLAPCERPSSGNLMPLVDCDALIIIPPDNPGSYPGGTPFAFKRFV